METIQDLEKRLGIEPVNFDNTDFEEFLNSSNLTKFNFNTDISNSHVSSTDVNEVIKGFKEDISETPAWLNMDSANLFEMKQKWNIPIENVDELFTHIKSIYQRYEDTRIKNICETILNGMYYNNITKKQVNDLIHELNGLL